MKKELMIVFIIFSSIISLLIILMEYFCIFRYIKLHYKSYKDISETFKLLPSAHSEKSVIVTFSSDKERINNIEPMINSILNQTVKVDHIVLIRPLFDEYKLPDFVENTTMKIPSGKDYGEFTNIVPLLLQVSQKDTIIISVKDNIVYGEDFIQTLIELSEEKPDCLLIDEDRTCMLLKPCFFKSDVINRKNKIYDEKWFLDRSKNSYIFKYNNNYKNLKL